MLAVLRLVGKRFSDAGADWRCGGCRFVDAAIDSDVDLRLHYAMSFWDRFRRDSTFAVSLPDGPEPPPPPLLGRQRLSPRRRRLPASSRGLRFRFSRRFGSATGKYGTISLFSVVGAAAFLGGAMPFLPSSERDS